MKKDISDFQTKSAGLSFSFAGLKWHEPEQ
jgi:hypothetical protein